MKTKAEHKNKINTKTKNAQKPKSRPKQITNINTKTKQQNTKHKAQQNT